MITARQHRPAFVDTDDPLQAATVPTLEALLAVPWIARFGQDDVVANAKGTYRRQFFRWSLADGDTLMAEYEDGDHFWVVAFLTSDDLIPLPAWHETETARRRRDAWNRGETG